MNPLLASPMQPSGYTWTIASRVSEALAEAEEQFGPRDRDYFYAGHEFVDGSPGTWYPGNRGHIVIQLGKQCLTEPNLAIFQLAHEVIHLLAPTGGRNANNLEEGLANWFSEDYCMRKTGQPIKADLPCYAEASAIVGKIIEQDSKCVKSMRETQPCISRIGRDLLRQHCPFLPDEEIVLLAAKFERTVKSTRQINPQ